MQRHHQVPNMQHYYQYPQHQQEQQQRQNIHHGSQNLPQHRNENFKPLSFRAPVNHDTIRPNNYFQAKELLLSNQEANAEFLKPSGYYHHNKVSNRNEKELEQERARTNQAQAPLTSGFHFKLLKSKKPKTQVASNVKTEKEETVKSETNTVVQSTLNENQQDADKEMLTTNISPPEQSPSKETILNESIKEELPQTALEQETLKDTVVASNQLESSLAKNNEELEKEIFTSNREADSNDAVSKEEVSSIEAVVSEED